MTKPIALALSGGGAAGLLHIAVLEAFDEAGVKPAFISGTSMGAVIGVLYASGLNAAQIREHVESLTSNYSDLGMTLIAGVSWRELGLRFRLSAEKTWMNICPGAVPETFDDLGIPFSATATDYIARRKHVFREGPIAPAIAASMAIPGLFHPVEIGGTTFVDGGLCDNLPVSAIPEDMNIVAVDVVSSETPLKKRSPSVLEISINAIQIMMEAQQEQQLQIYKPAAIIRPKSRLYGALDFLKAQEILATSGDIKQQTLDALTTLGVH